MKSHLRIAILFLLLVAVATAIAPTWRPKSETITKNYCVPAGGETYCIPKEYFLLPPIDPTGFLIQISWPSMLPAGSRTASGFGHRPQVRILVNDARTARQLDQAVALRLTNNPLGSMDPELGLITTSRRHEGVAFDLFYEDRQSASGKTPAYISCMTPDDLADGSRGIAICKHRFVEGDLAYTISYDKSELSRWRELKVDAIDLVNRFEAQ